MNLTLGQVLSGAGRVGIGWRVEEENQRKAQENQLKIEEQNRLNRLRQEMTQAPMPQTPDLMGQFARPDVQQVPVAPVAAPQITAPVQPVVQPAPAAQKPAVTNQDLAALSYLRQQDAAKMPTTPPVAVPKSPYAISTTKGSYVDKVSPDALRGGLAPANIMTQQSAIMSAEQKKLDSLKGKPTTGTVDQQKLLAAQQQVESGGKTTAVSPKGATGLMQVMPETAMNPGFGLPSVFDFAASKGIQVGKRDATTAAALLKMPEVGAEYGNMYSLAMAQKYGNNQTLQLIAYNMGPTATDKWLAAGGDMTKLPKETRDYVTKTLSLAGGEQPTVIKNVPVTPDGQIVKVADTKPPTPAVQKKVSDFYLANPEAIGGDMQRALRQRDELTRLAGMYQRSGMGMQYMELRNKIIELDEGMFYLQGMQGLQDLALANDPRRLSAVASHYAGTPIAFQPRTDGTYNVFVNGTMTKEGIGADEVSQLARRSFDSGYRQTMAQVSSEMATEQFKAGLDIQKENAKAYAKMIADVTVEGVKGNNSMRLEWLKANAGWDIKPSGAADGGFLIKPPNGSPFYYNSTPRTIEIDGVKIESSGAYPIAGLPSMAGVM